MTTHGGTGKSPMKPTERVCLMNSKEPRHLYGTGYTEKANCTDAAYLWQPVFKHLASLPGGSKVLDAGCGNGFFTRQLCEKGFDAVGMDLEESGIVHARKLHPGIRFEVASVYDDMGMLFGQQFDAVFSLEVIEHVYDPRAFVGRVRDCLRPGGMFVVSTPYHGYLKNLLLALSGKFDAHFTSLWDGGHIKFWSRKTLTSLLEEKGFRVDDFVGAGRLPYLWKSMILVSFRL